MYGETHTASCWIIVDGYDIPFQILLLDIELYILACAKTLYVDTNIFSKTYYIVSKRYVLSIICRSSTCFAIVSKRYVLSIVCRSSTCFAIKRLYWNCPFFHNVCRKRQDFRKYSRWNSAPPQRCMLCIALLHQPRYGHPGCFVIAFTLVKMWSKSLLNARRSHAQNCSMGAT